MTVDYPFKSPVEVDPNTHFIFLLKGVNVEGVNFFAYVRVEFDKRQEFADALQNNAIAFGDNCELIHGGEGEPSESVRAWMKEEFKFTDDEAPNLMEQV